MYGKPPTCITNKQYHSFISVLLPFYFIFFLILLEMTFDEVLEELHGKIIHHYYTARLPTVFLHVSSYSLCKLYLYLKMQIKLMLIRLHWNEWYEYINDMIILQVHEVLVIESCWW